MKGTAALAIGVGLVLLALFVFGCVVGCVEAV